MTGKLSCAWCSAPACLSKPEVGFFRHDLAQASCVSEVLMASNPSCLMGTIPFPPKKMDVAQQRRNGSL